MKTYLRYILFALFMACTLHAQAQYIIYIGTDEDADKAQRETTALLDINLKKVIDMQKKMHEAETLLNFELKEQESFLLKRYPSEQLIDSYIKDNPLVTKIFKERFANQEENLNSIRRYADGWEHKAFYAQSIDNIQSDMDDIIAQWKQATEISGNSNRMTNAQRNSLMEETLERFKQVCVTTQQLRTTMKALSMKDKNYIPLPNAASKPIK